MYKFDAKTCTVKANENSNKNENKVTHGEHYFKVWDFMVFDMKLAKTELLVYAHVFAMYHNYNKLAYHGSREYLAKWNNTSVRTISDAYKALEEKGFIVKITAKVNGRKRPAYFVDFDGFPTCEIFSKENYMADAFMLEREAAMYNGVALTKREQYQGYYDNVRAGLSKEDIQWIVDNKEDCYRDSEKKKNYYIDRKKGEAEMRREWGLPVKA